MLINKDILDNAKKQYDFYETPSHHADFIYNQCKTGEKMNVLDICCGLGSLSKPFYVNGHNVTLIEINNSFIPYLNQNYPKAKIINDDFFNMKTIDQIDQIDIILCNPPFNAESMPKVYMTF